MKIIDLLNKIAKGEEVPKKVSINGGIHGIDVWEYDENCKDYLNSSDIMLLYSGMTSNHLTDEVEVLEEVEDKEYEDIEETTGDYIVPNTPATENEAYIMACLIAHEQTLNALIRNQKKIMKRLDNDK